MLNDPERFRGHDPNLNPGGEFIFLPVFLRADNVTSLSFWFPLCTL